MESHGRNHSGNSALLDVHGQPQTPLLFLIGMFAVGLHMAAGLL
jgi:hypothetical protein